MAQAISLADWVAWCDVQLTKDGVGICFPDIKLDNASDIDVLFKNRHSNYSVNGVTQTGWFSIDFNFKDLALVSCKINSWPFASLTICFRLYGAIYLNGCLDPQLDLVRPWLGQWVYTPKQPVFAVICNWESSPASLFYLIS